MVAINYRNLINLASAVFEKIAALGGGGLKGLYVWSLNVIFIGHRLVVDELLNAECE